MNGTPLVSQSFTVSFSDVETKENVTPLSRIFHASLNKEIRKEMYQSFHQCHFSNTSKYIQTLKFYGCELIVDGSRRTNDFLSFYAKNWVLSPKYKEAICSASFLFNSKTSFS